MPLESSKSYCLNLRFNLREHPRYSKELQTAEANFAKLVCSAELTRELITEKADYLVRSSIHPFIHPVDGTQELTHVRQMLFTIV